MSAAVSSSAAAAPTRFMPVDAASRLMTGYRVTLHGYSRSAIVSLLQKAIRRGLVPLALFAAMELIQSQCVTRLITRLITMVSEDIGPAGGTLAMRVLVTLAACSPSGHRRKNADGVMMWRLLRDDWRYCAQVLAVVEELALAPKSRFGDEASQAWIKRRERYDGVLPEFAADPAYATCTTLERSRRARVLLYRTCAGQLPMSTERRMLELCGAALDDPELDVAFLCRLLVHHARKNPSPAVAVVMPLLDAVRGCRDARAGADDTKGNCSLAHIVWVLAHAETMPAAARDELVSPRVLDEHVRTRDAWLADETRVAAVLAHCAGPRVELPEWVFDMHTSAATDLARSAWFVREHEALTPRAPEYDVAFEAAVARARELEARGIDEKQKKKPAGGEKKKKPASPASKRPADGDEAAPKRVAM